MRVARTPSTDFLLAFGVKGSPLQTELDVWFGFADGPLHRTVCW